jgi:signal transduction histidine kinase
MKKAIVLAVVIFCVMNLYAQSNVADSLKQLLKTETNDTSRVVLLLNLSATYQYSKLDTMLLLSQQALSLSKKAGFIRGEAASLNNIAFVFLNTGNYPKALEAYLEALKKYEAIQNKRGMAAVLGNISNVYSEQGDERKSINYTFKALAIAKSINNQPSVLTNIGNLGDSYEKLNMLDSAKYYTIQGYDMAIQQKSKRSIGIALNNLGNIYSKMGNNAAAMHNYRLGISYHKEVAFDQGLCETYLGMAKLFQKAGNTDSTLYYATLCFTIAKKDGFLDNVMNASNFLTGYYTSMNNVDSAFVYQSAMIAAKDSLFSQDKLRQFQNLSLAETQRQQEIQDAKEEARTQMKFNLLIGGLLTLFVVAFILFRNNSQKRKANTLLQKQKEEIDAKALELSEQKEHLQQSYDNVEQLSEIGRKITSSLSVEKIIGTVYDNVNSLMDASVFGIGIYNDASKRIEFPATYEEGQPLPFYANSIDDENRFGVKCFKEGKEIIMGNLKEEHKLHIQEIATPHEGKQAVSLIYLPLIVKEKTLGVITVQSFQPNAYTDYHLFMLRNIAIYTAIALENATSFVRLQSAQKQLIQSEKMASLGELTAGIAHEIQNPLNFVNNFSEVNKELLIEMKEELVNGNGQEAISIANDVIENEQKINHHGKRADAIVKGMLQHSRSSTGQKELTDINTLSDEYFRLSYHGLRAKDKSFNADMKTDFDSSIGKINLIPQDIGRVILNLFNNAFYAVGEKQKAQGNGQQATGNGQLAMGNGQQAIGNEQSKYQPTVSVTTKKIDGHIAIHVKDNGNGIPTNVVDKIFQPFFTTKQTGEGTGLGLSLAYDIVKAHGGELKVESKENEGSEFVIQLPV